MADRTPEEQKAINAKVKSPAEKGIEQAARDKAEKAANDAAAKERGDAPDKPEAAINPNFVSKTFEEDETKKDGGV